MIQGATQAILFIFALIGAVAASIRINEWWKSRGQDPQPMPIEIDPGEDKRRREEERDELRSDILRTLINEIKYNHKILERGFQKRTRYFFLAFWDTLRTYAFMSVVTSEQYVLLSTEAQNKVAQYYDLVKQLNDLAEELKGEEKALTIQVISGQQTTTYNILWPLSQELISYLEEQIRA